MLLVRNGNFFILSFQFVGSFLLNAISFIFCVYFYSAKSPYRRGAFYSLFLFILLTVLPGADCFATLPDASGFNKLKHYKSEKIILNKGWKFHPGDDANWADPTFDDNQWQPIDPTQDIHYLTKLREAEIGWFRLHLQVDSSLLNIPLAMAILQRGASEIYLNGKLIHSLGVVSQNKEEEVLFNPNYAPYSFQFSGGSNQVLAISIPLIKAILT